MADARFRDRWSDHDFWIVTRAGHEDFYLDSPAWLPDADQILLSARQGAHYRTVIYLDGHKVEYGVFDQGTAFQGKIERYSVLLERGGILSLAQSVLDEAKRNRREQLFRPNKLVNLAILVWTFHERMERGEWLAAHRFLTFAVELLLDLITACVLPEDDTKSDFLDSTRRLEQRYPDLAAELKSILTTADLTSGPALLHLAERLLRDDEPDLEWDQVMTVCDWMEEPAG
jgi:lincosamide nucleotidyltransferase B/F